MMYEKVRHALLYNWDPIGVHRLFGDAYDEYEMYAPTICERLLRDVSQAELFNYLWELETKGMALVGNQQRTREFASHLKEIQREVLKT